MHQLQYHFQIRMAFLMPGQSKEENFPNIMRTVQKSDSGFGEMNMTESRLTWLQSVLDVIEKNQYGKRDIEQQFLAAGLSSRPRR